MRDIESRNAEFRITGGRPLLLLAMVVTFVDSVGYGVVVPVLPAYAENLGLSDFQIGFLFAMFAIALVIGAVPIGMLSDRFGRKPFIIFGMFAMSGAFVFYAFAESYSLLLVARALDGLTAAATWVAAMALVSESFDRDEMGGKMGFLMATSALGGIAGPVLGGVLSDALGYRAPFYAIAGTCLVAGAFSALLKEGRWGRKRTRLSFKRMLRPVLTNRTVLLASFLMVVSTLGLGLLEPTFPLYLEENFSMSPTGIGLVFGVMMLFYGAMSPAAGKLSDRLGRKKPIMVGLLATAILMPFLAVARNVPVLFVLMGSVGVTFALFSTPALPLVTDALPEISAGENAPAGTVFGLMNLFFSLGFALGPLIGGAIMGWAGLAWALVFCSTIMAVAGVVILILLPDTAQPPRAVA